MTSNNQQLSSPSLFDALYCEEGHWDNEEIEPEENCCRQEGNNFLDGTFVDLLGQDLWGDEYFRCLVSKERDNELYNGLEKNPSLAKARGETVEWILKVTGYYSFSALTAVLAVNYLDRFLFSFQSHKEKPWMIQLAAVACLSLAAKVEETRVPLLLDLQVEESRYAFEPKTIQRMEILVLSTLEWKMNPVTPLSFLDYIARSLGLKSNICFEFLRRCELLLLSIISDHRFMCHLPSALATATMLYVISTIEPCIGMEYQDQLIAILGTKKEKVENCCTLIQELATSVHFHSNQKRKFGSFPCSPKGVMDVSFSSDSSNDSWAVATIASVSSSPEPLSKRIKSQNPD